MLTYSVPTNWDDNLIKEIEILDSGHKITEIYGKLSSDFVGGGRPAYAAIKTVSKNEASWHIRLIKSAGRKFNYLLNASCLDNREFTRSGQKEIRKLLSWLDRLRIDTVTVSNPYLGYLIKKEYPRFELAVSSHALTDSVRKVQFWAEEIGANKIVLPPRTGRNFSLLRKFRSVSNCELQVLANQMCQYECPLAVTHTNFIAHASQTHQPLKGFCIDWYRIKCRYNLLVHPEELIKSRWIRPEDSGYYESIGINSLKIIDRTWRTQYIVSATRAYLERKFDGNLIDILSSISSYTNELSRGELFRKGLRFFLHPLHINIFKLIKFRHLFYDIGIYIDSRKLGGFLDYFFEDKCSGDCISCDYCNNIAAKAVHIDKTYKEKMEKLYWEIIDGLINGDMFRYF